MSIIGFYGAFFYVSRLNPKCSLLVSLEISASNTVCWKKCCATSASNRRSRLKENVEWSHTR